MASVANDERRDRVRAAGLIPLRETRDERSPVVRRGVLGPHAARFLSTPAERFGPAGSRAAVLINGVDGDVRAVFVEGDESDAGVAGELQFETADASFGIFVEVRQQSLDERVSRGVEVDVLILYRVFAIERS